MPGSGVLPELVRLAERLLGLGQLTETEPYLAELVEGCAGDARVPEAKLLAGAVGELLGLAEPPLELHHLGVVHPAHAGKARPVFASQKSHGAVGPLARALEVGDVAAGADRVAVDRERREGVELAGERGRARLVEQELALGDLALRDQRVPLTLQPRISRLRSPKRRPSSSALPRELQGLAEVARAELVEALLQRPVAVLGRLVLAGRAGAWRGSSSRSRATSAGCSSGCARASVATKAARSVWPSWR